MGHEWQRVSIYRLVCVCPYVCGSMPLSKLCLGLIYLCVGMYLSVSWCVCISLCVRVCVLKCLSPGLLSYLCVDIISLSPEMRLCVSVRSG